MFFMPSFYFRWLEHTKKADDNLSHPLPTSAQRPKKNAKMELNVWRSSPTWHTLSSGVLIENGSPKRAMTRRKKNETDDEVFEGP